MCLGDAIIKFAKTGIIDNKDLKDLYNNTQFKSQSNKIIPIDRNKFTPESPFNFRYITYQFDKALTQKTWCPEHIFTNRQIYALYHYYESRSKGIKMIDVGHYKYPLAEAANIIFHAEAHVGLCSGMGWLSVACGKTPDIWYSTESNCKFVQWAKDRWKDNNVTVNYFDKCFFLKPCTIAYDGLKYVYKQ